MLAGQAGQAGLVGLGDRAGAAELTGQAEIGKSTRLNYSHTAQYRMPAYA